MGLIVVTSLFISLMVFSLSETLHLRPLKELEKGKRPDYRAILALIAILAALPGIAGSEAPEHALLSVATPPPAPADLAPAETPTVPLALDREEKEARIGSILSMGGLIKSVSSSISLSVEEEYNDNIYQDANASESDFITQITLGMAANLSGPLFNIKLNYQPEQILFSRHTDKNEFRHEFNILLNTGLDKKITLIRNLAFLDLSDKVTRETYHARRETRKEDFAVKQTTTNELKINPFIMKNLTSTNSLECGYEYTNTAYSVFEATDHESSGASLILNRKFSRKLEGTVSYRLIREFVRSGDFHDYDRQEVSLGLSDQVAPSLKLIGTGGYGWLSFNSGDKNQEAFWNIDLNGALPLMRAPTFFYRYETSYQNSIDSGALKLRRHSLGVDYQRRIHLVWAMFSQQEDYQELDWTDVSRGMDTSLTVPVHKKVDLTLSGEWARSDFEPDEEKVRYHSTDTGIRWRIFPSFQCAAGYRYYKNDSTIEMNDYRNTVSYIRASLEW